MPMLLASSKAEVLEETGFTEGEGLRVKQCSALATSLILFPSVYKHSMASVRSGGLAGNCASYQSYLHGEDPSSTAPYHGFQKFCKCTLFLPVAITDSWQQQTG